MIKEFNKKKKNHEALFEMQKITFSKRREVLDESDGRNVVEKLLETYPWLADDQMVM